MATKRSVKRFLRADFADLDPYAPVKPLDVLAAEIGVPADELAKLDANENLHGPLPEIVEAVSKSQWHIYPDPAQTRLREAISGYVGVPTERIVCGCGSDELIDLLMRVTDPKAIVNSLPTFGMYSFLAKIGRIPVINLDRSPFPEFAEDEEGIVAAVQGGANLVILTSPNNPTGGLVSESLVRRLCDLDCVVVVDEAYAEFAGYGDGGHGSVGSLASLAGTEELPNLVVFRTFSKWAALAGVRVGFSVAHPSLTAAIAAIKQPYNVNVAADLAAQAAIRAYPRVRELQLVPMLRERDAMEAKIREEHSWLVPAPSRANFVLFKVDTSGTEEGNALGRAAPCVAGTLVDELRRRGVLVRYYPKGHLAGFVRISAGRPQDTARLFRALKDIEAGTTNLVPTPAEAAAVAAAVAIAAAEATDTATDTATATTTAGVDGKPVHAPLSPPPVDGAVSYLLLDMDGVLVEVGQSYRQAIVRTAHHFGATSVTMADIDAIKAQGGANNDWEVTHRLVQAALQSTSLSSSSSSETASASASARIPSLKRVIRVFERLYNGTDETPRAEHDAGMSNGHAKGSPAALKHLEEPLVSVGQLRCLKAAVKGMALVTGRPLRDAVEALERYGWSFRLTAVQEAALGRAAGEHGSKAEPPLFDTVVTMEDGPAKPSPAPLRTALARMGAQAGDTARALMVGDTVDDARAAVAAGCRAVGVLTVGKDGEAAAASEANLRLAGAALVLPPRLTGLQAIVDGGASLDAGASSSSSFSGTGAKRGLSSGAVAAAAARDASDRAGDARHRALHAERPVAPEGVAAAREATVVRETGETAIEAWVRVDGSGWSAVWTGVGFLDHMLCALAKHSRMDIHLVCAGDTWVDDHHTVEDCCLALGEALDGALGKRAGITRWGMAHCPLDEALSRAVVDVSSRPHAQVSLSLSRDSVGALSAEMAGHAISSLVTAARLTAHVDVLRGENDHHKIESAFKALAVAMRQAFSRDTSAGVPSTKGVLA